MTTELPSIGYRCLLCGKLLTHLENNHATEELNRIISERTNEQLKAIEKQYNKMSEERLQNKDRAYQQEIQKKDRMLLEKDSQLEELKNNADKRAREEVRKELEEERERSKGLGIQLERCRQEIRKLNLKLATKQSELKGEIGEINLEELLQDFSKKGDIITLKKRKGENTADIIHQIMGPNRQLLETVIVYDNKNTQTINDDDVRKSKSYREIHNTDYSIIVSRTIPKKYSTNGRYAEKDGVIITNPEVLVPIVENIRRGLIEISKMSNNKQEILTKQSKLYGYITGNEFSRQLEAIYSIHARSTTLQDDEEKRHKTMWRKRTELNKELKELYTNISSGLDAILNDADLVNGDFVSP
jgi:hypothetical protein